MKLLVTGGAGFIGSNFIHYWLKNHPDDAIVNLDKLCYSGNLESLKDLASDSRYTFVKGDICDLNLVRNVIQKNSLDTIVHFAAQSHVDRSISYEHSMKGDSLTSLFEMSLPEDFVLNNVWGTHILLEAAVKEKVKRFHHVSTDEVFGALTLDGGKFDEFTPYDPRSPYSASKAASDHLVRAYKHTYGLAVTISNTANNYGPFMYPEKLLPLAITNLIEGKKVPIYGDGKYVRDWLFVDDHCRGIDLILKKGVPGETYLIGGLWQDVNNLELIRRVLKIMGKDDSSLEFVKDRPGHDRRYAINFEKAKRELGYEPKCDLDTYLKIMVEWYEQNRWWWEPIKSGTRYKEYYRKQYSER